MAATLIKNQAIGAYSDYYLRLYFEETVDSATNSSSVTVSLYGYTERAYDYCSYNNYGGNAVSITIDGTTNTLSGQNIDTRQWRVSGGYLLHSYTKTVQHNSDGSKTITVSGSIKYDDGDSASLPAGTYSTGDVSKALTDIAISSSLNMWGGERMTNPTGHVTLTLSKANSAFYDRAVVTAPNSGTYNAANSGLGNTIQIPWSDILTAMPTTKGTYLKFKIQSYSDAQYTSMVGESQEYNLSVYCDPTSMTPDVSFVRASSSAPQIVINTGGLGTKLVAGQTTVKADWQAISGYGTTIASVKIESEGCEISSGGSSTAISGTVISRKLPESRTSNYAIRFKITATDARGFTSSVYSDSATVYAYKPPTATLTAYRVASSGSTTEDPAGVWAYITYTTALGASVGGDNTLTTTTTPTNLTPSGTWRQLAASSVLNVTVRATDAVGVTTTVKVRISSAKVPLSLYSSADGASIGAAIGEAAVADKFRVTVPLYLNDTTAVGTVLNASSTRTSLARNAETDLCSLSLTKGVWVIIGQFRMQGGADFQCSIGISTTSGSQQLTAGYAQLPVTTNVGNISTSVQRIIEVTAASQTIYLVGWHNHTAARSMVSGQNSLTAVCIA